MSTEPLSSDCKNFYSIREELCRFDISYSSFQVEDFSEVKSNQFPAVCLFKENEKSHFVVLKKILFNRYFILDPNFGEYVLSKEEFLLFYQGKALLKDGKVKKEKPQKVSLLNGREKCAFFSHCFVISSYPSALFSQYYQRILFNIPFFALLELF